jgi:hypothetical protein
VLNGTLMLGGIPIFATSAAWSGVAIPVIALLIVAVTVAATSLSGWGSHFPVRTLTVNVDPPE